MKNTFGQSLSVTLFGESHGPSAWDQENALSVTCVLQAARTDLHSTCKRTEDRMGGMAEAALPH